MESLEEACELGVVAVGVEFEPSVVIFGHGRKLIFWNIENVPHVRRVLWLRQMRCSYPFEEKILQGRK